MTTAATQLPAASAPPALDNGRPPSPRPFSPPEIAFMIGVPLLWAILLLFHPTGDDYYLTAKDHVARWETVHIGMLVFIPLMVGVMLLLLRGIDGLAAKISRFALAPFAVFYLAWEVLVGIGTGLLVDDVNRLAASERGTGRELIDEFVDSQVNAVFNAIGTAAWLVAVVAAAVALYRRGHGSRSVPMVVLLVLSAPLIAMHVTPFGPTGLALFIGAVLLVLRGARTGNDPVGERAAPTHAI